MKCLAEWYGQSAVVIPDGKVETRGIHRSYLDVVKI